MKNFDDLAARLESVDGVVSVTPQVQGQVMITTPGAATGGLVRGLRPEDIAARPILARNIKVGSLGDSGVDVGTLIGPRLTSQLCAGVGGSGPRVHTYRNHTATGSTNGRLRYRQRARETRQSTVAAGI